MKSGRTLIDLAQELERQIATKQDLVLPSSLLQCRTDEGGNLKLIVEAGNHIGSGGGEYGITSLARRQLADKLKIPFAYFERMRAGQPDLLDRNVNTWLQSRRQLGGVDAVKKAPVPDFRKRQRRISTGNK